MKQRIHGLLFLLVLAAVTSCTTSTKVRSGTEAFELKKYSMAAPMLEEEFSKAKDNASKASLALKLAQSYDLQNKFMEAEKWYDTYRNISPEPEAPILYSKALMKNEKYEEAAKIIKEYLAVNRQDRLLYGPLLSTCELMVKEGKDYSKEVLVEPAAFNSPFADYDAFLLDGTVYFSSTRSKGKDDLPEDWLGHSFASLWKAERNAEQAQAWDLFTDDFHVASPSFTKDQKTVYFTRCGTPSPDGTDYCSIYKMTKDRLGEWSEPDRISFFGDTSNCGQPFISADGNTLYFVSDAPFGYGGKDLYMALLQRDGTYSEPINLGARVNTTYNEVFPFVTEDGNTLYYSSDNLQGFGGLDLYKAGKSGRLFSNPERLPYGINSGGDDFSLRLIAHNTADTTILWKGIFSSNRAGGKGNDDIYFATLKKTEPKPLPPGLLIFEGFAEENVFAEADNPNSKVTGKQPVPYPSATLSGLKLVSDKDGFFTTPVDSGLAYQLRVSKEGYLAAEISFNTNNIKVNPGDTVFLRQKVLLNKIFMDVEIVLENIYYDFDKWDIREDARPTLDSLARILQQNPTISIELASHTDCRGNDEYNMTLSQRRAESAVQYLINKGISTTRMLAKGYGESIPVATCICAQCTEEEHQRNRRTTFKIVKE
jgi:peptidoglycan-associated lipoprotein